MMINRQDVLEAIEKLESYTWDENPVEGRPKGKWEMLGKYSRRCDRCEVITFTTEDYNYCPNCGAEMESE